MTRLQHQLLAFIREQIEATGICPTYAQMAEALSVKSKSGPHRLVDILVREGQLVRGQPGSSQSLRLAQRDLRDVPTDFLVQELKRRGVRLG
jgi:repressor LexA